MFLAKPGLVAEHKQTPTASHVRNTRGNPVCFMVSVLDYFYGEALFLWFSTNMRIKMSGLPWAECKKVRIRLVGPRLPVEMLDYVRLFRWNLMMENRTDRHLLFQEIPWTKTRQEVSCSLTRTLRTADSPWRPFCLAVLWRRDPPYCPAEKQQTSSRHIQKQTFWTFLERKPILFGMRHIRTHKVRFAIADLPCRASNRHTKASLLSSGVRFYSFAANSV